MSEKPSPQLAQSCLPRSPNDENKDIMNLQKTFSSVMISLEVHSTVFDWFLIHLKYCRRAGYKHCFENMALTLTEDLIRNRVGLEHDNLEDVKSLALPGTYHEKVVSLGTSLRKFSRLKHIDLSRNNVSALQGLEHLKLLEKLNLYPYMNTPSFLTLLS
ncbi:CEP72-like protein [Mya arenaria]|uniref:CEP72-like protein n=1 Tax=Mya arenaria TaxID=6604 RepID=A0ABY7EX92_MYAAR|nr:CEP72-like protein [Mya arenaria]